MDTPEAALQGQLAATGNQPYTALDLGKKNWKLALSDGVRAPGHYTVPLVMRPRFLSPS